MGLFNRKKKDTQDKTQMENNQPVQQPLNLVYSSGDTASITFGEIVVMDDCGGKVLQKIQIFYEYYNAATRENKFEGPTCLIEPHVAYLDENQVIYDTEEYYKKLAQDPNTFQDVKGMFKREELGRIKHDIKYIGSLEYNANNQPYRNTDKNFEKLYDAKKEKEIEDSRNKSYQQGLQDAYNNVEKYGNNYTSYCRNEASRVNSIITDKNKKKTIEVEENR